MSVGEDCRFNFIKDCSDSQKGFDTSGDPEHAGSINVAVMD